ncbi:hypothetical protein GQ53DRAFT_835444 [Thozetella sp. PMI_491]|nr:hypothetical protein GQ53DRAFT_835444 [Thozetella sp. PMI_491]
MERQRQRRQHTRSRTGCLPCKQRHIRCDEKRPTCINCRIAARECDYGLPALPLRERRQQKQPFLGTGLWKLPKPVVLDPFDDLPIQMEYRSRELFHYFAATPWEAACSNGKLPALKEKFGVPPSLVPLIAKLVPFDGLNDPLRLSIYEPLGLRGTMMLAGLHFKLMSYDVDTFDNTFFFHKGEAIQFVNKGLVDQSVRYRAGFMKLIAMLSVLESCARNLDNAEAHIQGLLTLFEVQESEMESADEDGSHDEVVQRLFVMAHFFVEALRCRRVNISTKENEAKDGPRHVHLSGLGDNLAALRLMPAFLSPLTSNSDVDGTHAMVSIQCLTHVIERKQNTASSSAIAPVPQHVSGFCEGANAADCLGCMSIAGLLLAFTVIHSKRLPAKVDPVGTRMRCSWSSFAISTSFYLNAVLGVWNMGLSYKSRIMTRLLAIHKKDMERVEAGALDGTVASEMLFWQIFVAAYALKSTPAKEFKMERQFLYASIRKWSVTTRTAHWEDARDALEKITWPNTPWVDERGKKLWTDALCP